MCNIVDIYTVVYHIVYTVLIVLLAYVIHAYCIMRGCVWLLKRERPDLQQVFPIHLML